MKVAERNIPQSGQLIVIRKRVGDGYLICNCPQRKQKALMRWNEDTNTYTPVAYFRLDEEAENFKNYMQELITIGANSFGGIPVE